MLHKRVFNLLWGDNQGSGLLLARGLEKRELVALVNTLEKIEYSLGPLKCGSGVKEYVIFTGWY